MNTEQTLSLQHSLDNLLNQRNDWKMLFSLSQFKVLHFDRGNSNFNYSMDGVVLDEVTEEPNSGVMVTQFFKSCKQCNLTATKQNRVVRILKKTITSRDSTVITILQNSLVTHHLECPCSLGIESLSQAGY